jgi:hypothetical protein
VSFRRCVQNVQVLQEAWFSWPQCCPWLNTTANREVMSVNHVIQTPDGGHCADRGSSRLNLLTACSCSCSCLPIPFLLPTPRSWASHSRFPVALPPRPLSRGASVRTFVRKRRERNCHGRARVFSSDGEWCCEGACAKDTHRRLHETSSSCSITTLPRLGPEISNP